MENNENFVLPIDFKGFLPGKPYQFDDYNSWIIRNNFFAVSKGYDFFPIAEKFNKGLYITLAEGILFDKVSGRIFLCPRCKTSEQKNINAGYIYERGVSYIIDTGYTGNFYDEEIVSLAPGATRKDMLALVVDNVNKKIKRVFLLDFDIETAALPADIDGLDYSPVCSITRVSEIDSDTTYNQIIDLRVLLSV